jgi:hypothetical protein
MGGKEYGMKKRSIGQEIVKSLQEFNKVLESGEPLEKHFRVTTIKKVNGKYVKKVKGPKKKEGDY